MKQWNGFSCLRALVVVSLALASCAHGAPSRDEKAEGGDGGGSGTGSLHACPVDCGTIETPPCLISFCDALSGTCVVAPGPSGASCEDGQFCTIGDSCQNGICVAGAPNDCGKKPGTCAVVHCDEATKTCSEGPAEDGAPCSPGDACTINASCKAGACLGEPKSCYFAPVPDDCHVAVCNPGTGACEAVPGNDGAACEEGGDVCATGKTCAAGVCQGGTPKDCSGAADDCNSSVCDAATGACVPVPLPAGGLCGEAKDECNVGVCDATGLCQKKPTPGVACASASDDCNQGICNASGACLKNPINEGGACSDSDACTTGETCAAGLCQGGKADGYVVYLSETFADNAAGWTLEGQWEIGKAEASPGSATQGYEDPGADHSETNDEGVAGVAIGGYISKTVAPAKYLVSPPLDTQSAAEVHLSFYRWLNSDYMPYLKNTLDVFDGNSWVNLWSSGGPPPIQDQAWTRFSYNLTPFKNASLRVRFGYQVLSNNVITVSGWNVDDVMIANKDCGAN